jgi:hypothetical protein
MKMQEDSIHRPPHAEDLARARGRLLRSLKG